MRTYYPITEGHSYGFHHNFSAADASLARDADAMLAKLTPEQVKGDPQVAAALKAIQKRTLNLGKAYGGNGMPRGLSLKQG